MNLVEQAYLGLFPGQHIDFTSEVKYSGQFKGYNANIRRHRGHIQVKMAKQWRSIDKDIRIGLIQELLLKIYKKKGKTTNIDLYNIFLRNAHLGVVKGDNDPVLDRSFNRVRDRYFKGFIDMPNLIWGARTTRKLGSYDYSTDTITISSIFKGEEQLLDYIMYHELLHKKHKFTHNSSKNYHHTKRFKEDEKKFENFEEMEQRIKRLTSKRLFGFWPKSL